MNTFSEELRRERIARNIALTEIAAQTRISLRFLEAIEQGSFDVLPQAYVRAFLREYAESVGLSSAEVLRRYDVMVAGRYATPESGYAGSGWGSGTLPPVEPPPAPPVAAARDEHKDRIRKIQVVAVGGIALAILIVVLLERFPAITPSEEVRETPFRDVVKEQELLRTPAQAPTRAESTAAFAREQDSLLLRGTTRDSVWLAVAADDRPPESAFLLSNATRTWRAKEKFRLTVGNARAIRFSLNGKELDSLARLRGVLRNVTITRATVSSLPQ